eukprot:89754_1
MACAVDRWQPRTFGRGCRIMCGFIMLLMVENAWNVESMESIYYVTMVILNVYLLQFSINLMFDKPSFGHKPQILFIGLWLTLFIFDSLNINGYLPRLLCNVVILYSFGLIGTAYILCGILGVGGCELMAYYAIFNHFKTGSCSCDEIDCPLPISPLYIFDKIEMLFAS